MVEENQISTLFPKLFPILRFETLRPYSAHKFSLDLNNKPVTNNKPAGRTRGKLRGQKNTRLRGVFVESTVVDLLLRHTRTSTYEYSNQEYRIKRLELH